MNNRKSFLVSALALVMCIAVCRATEPETRPAINGARREKAEEYLKKALTAAKAEVRYAGDIWGNIAVTQASLGNMKDSLDSLERSDGYCGTEAHTKVAKIQLQAGDRNGAKLTIDKAFALLKNEGKYLRIVSSRGVIEVQVAVGDLAGARATVKINDLPIGRLRVLEEMAMSQWKAGDKTGAEETFAACAKLIGEEPELKGQDRAFVSDRAEIGDIDGARKGLETFKGSDRTFLLASIGAAELKAGNKVGAKADCEEARRGVSTYNDGATSKDKLATADLLVALRKVYAGVGEERVVEELLKETQKALAEAQALLEKEGGALLTFKLSMVAVAQREQNDLKGAKETCNAIVAIHEKAGNADKGYASGLWAAAGEVAPIDPSLARELVGKAMVAPPPLDKIQAEMEVMVPSFEATSVAAGIVEAEGAKADLAWVEKLKTEQAKAHAYAAAAAAMVRGGEKEE